MNNELTTVLYCRTEYDPLQHVLVVPPAYMEITEVINETQAHYVTENIDQEAAMEQHEQFVDVLREEGIIVEFLEAQEELNEQVFTRDIGFVIGEKLFVSSMDREIRKKETDVLIDWLEEQSFPYTLCHAPSIEGGDVVIDGKQIWIGNSGRTNREAIQELTDELPEYQVTEIRLRDDILHLDCVFNVVRADTALIYEDAIHKEDLALLKQHYHLIPLTDEEQFQMGPNVLGIGNSKIISLPENKDVNKKLSDAGFEVIEIPFSEIIKSGGSYRCCTLPLLRTPK